MTAKFVAQNLFSCSVSMGRVSAKDKTERKDARIKNTKMYRVQSSNKT